MREGLRFDGRVAVVTGAGRGLGRAHALLLASRGARVVVNDLGTGTDGVGATSIGPASDVTEEILAAGGEAISEQSTVATATGGRAMVERAIDAWGRVDIVIHNAGIGSVARRVDDLTEDDLRRVVDTHLIGAFNVLRAAWPAMEQQRYGRIVLTSSAMALGGPFGADYCAVKGGLISLARSLAMSGAAIGIKANAVMPIAWTRLSAIASTEPTKEWMQRNFPPEAVAQAVAWLSHERVPVTGETFSVGANRIARIFYGAVPGYTSAQLTPEDIDAHLDEIMDVSNFVVATSGQSDSNFFVTDDPDR